VSRGRETLTLGTGDGDVERAARILSSGGLVAFPTETVYGLGANALDERAVAGIFAAKRRPSFDPLIVHVSSADGVEEVAEKPSGAGAELAAALWPGPLTLVLRKKAIVPGLVTSGLATVAVRVPAPELTRRLIARAGVPVAAPSANRFGRLSPTSARHVLKTLGGEIDAVLDGGPCEIGVESTIVDVTGEIPLVLRPGGLDLARIRAITGRLDLFDRSTATPTAPGQLENHYAPVVSLRLFDRLTLGKAAAAAPPPEGCRALVFSREELEALGDARDSFAGAYALSESGDPIEASARLFSLLHELEESGGEIWAERAPDASLGIAINDRLWKASDKS
jgi:L-threonylcarbamoyladenylate synthase